MAGAEPISLGEIRAQVRALEKHTDGLVSEPTFKSEMNRLEEQTRQYEEKNQLRYESLRAEIMATNDKVDKQANRMWVLLSAAALQLFLMVKEFVAQWGADRLIG